MIYRVVIIDNGNQVSLMEQNGVRSMEGVDTMYYDVSLMDASLDLLIKAYEEEKDDRKDYSR